MWQPPPPTPEWKALPGSCVVRACVREGLSQALLQDCVIPVSLPCNWHTPKELNPTPLAQHVTPFTARPTSPFQHYPPRPSRVNHLASMTPSACPPAQYSFPPQMLFAYKAEIFSATFAELVQMPQAFSKWFLPLPNAYL